MQTAGRREVEGWDHCLCDIDASEDGSGLRDPWEPLSQELRRKVVEVQVDVVLLWADTATFTDLHCHRAGDDVAGC